MIKRLLAFGLFTMTTFGHLGFAAEQRWCGDNLPFSFVKDGINILVVRPNQITTCSPAGGNTYICSDELSGASVNELEVFAEILRNGDLLFGSKGKAPVTYKTC